MSDTLCVVCQRREPARGLVCDLDRGRMAEQLTTLPGLIRELGYQLVPAVTGRTERVSVSTPRAPMPARGDVLSLAAPGSPDTEWVPALSVTRPAVRQWSTTHTVLVEVVRGGQVVREERTVVDWHREMVPGGGHQPSTTCACGDDTLHPAVRCPALVVDDDQSGLLPPAEWLDMWTRRWRLHFGHHVPSRTHHRPPPTEAQRRDHLRAHLWRLATQPVTAAATAWFAALARAARRHKAATATGMVGYQEPADRPDDPLAAEWQARFGDGAARSAAAGDIRYLLTWLDHACDTLPDIGQMATQLHTLTCELDRVLGRIPDQQWLGRCPAMLITRATERDGGEDEGVRRPCGAGLWQDPHASQVRCARCQSTWGPDPRQLLALARDIRDVWPLDRRRRYTGPERDLLPAPKCPSCDSVVTVQWRDVTEPGDRERWWRIGAVTCRLGCPDAARSV